MVFRCSLFSRHTTLFGAFRPWTTIQKCEKKTKTPRNSLTSRTDDDVIEKPVPRQHTISHRSLEIHTRDHDVIISSHEIYKVARPVFRMQSTRGSYLNDDDAGADEYGNGLAGRCEWVVH